MPNPWTGKGNPYTRKEVVERLRATLKKGDAIIAALQVLSAMVHDGRGLHELRAGMRKLPQHMVNVRVAQRADPMAIPAVSAAVRGVENGLAGRGRVLLRASGTEPVIRVMVEAEDAVRVEALALELAEVVRGD